MQLIDTLENFLISGVSEILQEKPRNYQNENPKKLAQETAIKKQTFIKKENIKNNPSSKTSSKKKALIKEYKPINNIIANAQKLAEQSLTLAELKKNIENFSGCSLKETAKNTVFADGNEESDIVLIGEAPGEKEDLSGVPFCGISGQLLDDIFRSISYKRKNNLYIMNSVFWRPPGNRKPTPEEIAICKPFVEKHISLKKPKLIVLIGSTSMQSIMPEITDTISKVRGNFFKYKNPYLAQEVDITAIFHPSYLLRQPAKKKIMWSDMLNINKYLQA